MLSQNIFKEGRNADIAPSESPHFENVTSGSSVLPDKYQVPGFYLHLPDNRPVFEKTIELLIMKTNTVKLVIFGSSYTGSEDRLHGVLPNDCPVPACY